LNLTTNANCPVCSAQMQFSWETQDIPYFGEAMLIAGDATGILVISGMGDVLDPDDGIAAIGSGGNYALAAARALANHSKLDNKSIVTEAVRLASEICVYTNSNLVVEEI